MTLREDALWASYRRLERPLYNVLYRLLWQREDCQDLIHDAYVRVWSRRDGVDEATLDALIWTTALNLAKNRLRWRALWPQQPLDDEALVGAAGVHDVGAATDFLAARRLHRALRQLPLTLRNVLLMSEFSGLRGADIAAILGIPAGTVASRKHHAMDRLRTLMGDTTHA
jgi:RNA polymerase sigma-70 factor (ECF subfamily)